VRTVVHVTVAASTLLGLDEAPGELGGFGPIPAVLARELASASAPTSGTDVGAGDGACNGANRLCGDDVTWQRILTDPVTGIATDVSRRTYRPGVVLGDLVRARDATCTFPGCRVPAPRCDLDHVEPFDHGSGGGGSGGGGIVSGGNGPGGRGTAPPGEQRGGATGQTRAANLHPVCRRHHNLKTHGGWTTTRDPATGCVTWAAPSGHVHVVGAHVTDPARLDDDLGVDDLGMDDLGMDGTEVVHTARRCTDADLDARSSSSDAGIRTPHWVQTRRARRVSEAGAVGWSDEEPPF
jgi:hypothetical protein